MQFDAKQLTTLAMIIAMSGAGGSLMAGSGSTPYAVLREELDRLERRTERRHDALMQRVREIEKWGPGG